MSKLVKSVRKLGRSVRKRILPDKIDKGISRLTSNVSKVTSNVEDIVTGKTPDFVREIEAEQAAGQAAKDKVMVEKLEGQEAEAKAAEVRRATQAEKLRASRLRARRVGRRSLMSAGRLGPTEETQSGKTTLG